MVQNGRWLLFEAKQEKYFQIFKYNSTTIRFNNLPLARSIQSSLTGLQMDSKLCSAQTWRSPQTILYRLMAVAQFASPIGPAGVGNSSSMEQVDLYEANSTDIHYPLFVRYYLGIHHLLPQSDLDAQVAELQASLERQDKILKTLQGLTAEQARTQGELNRLPLAVEDLDEVRRDIRVIAESLQHFRRTSIIFVKI